MDRRTFIKTSALLAAGGSMLLYSGCRRKKPKGESRMKLSWAPYQLELAHTFTVSSYSRKTTPDVQVEIQFEDFVGYGEASMPPYLGHTVDSVCTFLSKVHLEQFRDPCCIEEIMQYVDSLSPGDEPAKAAIDIALHDLAGKIMGHPCYRMFGLNPHKTPSTSFTIGIDTPEVVVQKTREALGRFNVLKVKVGLDTDRQMIEAIRSVTDLPIVVDANQGWKDRLQALEMAWWLKGQGVQLIEQPMPVDRLDDTAWLTERSPLPIIADESVKRLKDIDRIKGAFSGINIKLMKCTGLNEARKMIDYARNLDMTVMLGCMTETSCATTAIAHLSPACDFADIDGNLLITNDRFSGVQLRGGRLILPHGPGLGLKKL